MPKTLKASFRKHYLANEKMTMNGKHSSSLASGNPVSLTDTLVSRETSGMGKLGYENG